MDLSDTFAPVLKFTFIRILLAVVTKLQLNLHQKDVVTAFLYGKLEEDFYMKQPEGPDKRNPEATVCRLDRSLSRLKQALLQWIDEIG